MHPYDMFIKIYGRLPTERDPKYLELVRMTKYRITDIPDTQPGKCSNCGGFSRDGRKYVDIGVDVEFYGALLFCSLCIADIARTLGLFKAYEIKIIQLEEEINRLKTQTVDTEDLKNTVLQTYEKVVGYFGNSAQLESDVQRVLVDSLSVEPVDENATESDRETGKTDSGPVKSNAKPGSKNIPSLTEFINSSK